MYLVAGIAAFKVYDVQCRNPGPLQGRCGSAITQDPCAGLPEGRAHLFESRGVEIGEKQWTMKRG